MIPDWKLERFLTGDLPEEEMKKIQELEASDVMLAQRIKMFREDNKAILNKFPFETLAGKIAEAKNVADVAGAAKTAPKFNLVKFAAAAVFVLAVALVAFMAQRETVVSGGNVAGSDMAQARDVENTQLAYAEKLDGNQSDTRIKGLAARMEVWKKTASGIAQLQNLDEVHEGDEIQLRYAVPEKCFGILFSMDGNGALTLHMGDGEKSIALVPGSMNTLPFAYKLDNAPYFEKFFLITSQNEFAVDEKDIDALLKRSDANVVEFTLKKAGK